LRQPRYWRNPAKGEDDRDGPVATAGTRARPAFIIPGTSQLATTRFPHTVVVQPDAQNGLREPTVFLAVQPQAVDNAWIVHPSMGRLSEAHLTAVENAVLEALGFDPPDE
jgi:PemK-like, MazF-like toxin of type II toxin-antitoxin system